MASLLNARTAVITGGAQGLGLAIGQRFVAEGARVVLGDVNLEATEVAAKRLGGDDVALAVRCDVTQADDVDILIRTAVERFGGLDVMVNNAGITRDATMRTMTEEQFDQVIAVHLKGTWNGTRLAAAIMRERKRGAIVNMSSVSGKVGMVGQTNYSAAKAGIVGMTKAAAKELAHLGIRVNAIAPGLIRSAMTEAMPQRIWDQKLAEVPMGRAGEPSEVASVAVFLASDLSSYMTGTVLDVTGGRFICHRDHCHGTAIRQEGNLSQCTGPRTWQQLPARNRRSAGCYWLARSPAARVSTPPSSFSGVPAHSSWRCALPSTVIGT